MLETIILAGCVSKTVMWSVTTFLQLGLIIVHLMRLSQG